MVVAVCFAITTAIVLLLLLLIMWMRVGAWCLVRVMQVLALARLGSSWLNVCQSSRPAFAGWAGHS